MTSDRGRHRQKAGRSRRIITWSVVGALTLVVAWAGVSFAGTYRNSPGEPTNVVVATWMRDNHMGSVVAQLENLYYRYVDTPQVGGTPTVSADVSAEDDAGADDSDVTAPSLAAAAFAAVAPSPEATLAPSSGANVMPTGESVPVLLTPARTVRDPSAAPFPTPASPSPLASTLATRAHLDPPPPIMSPVKTPQPMEGEWQPVASRVDGIPAVYVTRVRADNVHTSFYASVMWIDTLLTRAMLVPGREEPGGPNPYDGALPKDLWPDVLANINGAFRLDDTLGGYYYKGDTVKPLVNGKAAAVIDKDGSIRIGKWGRDFSMTKDVDVVRQNLDLIVDKGVSQVSNGADHVIWGATTDKESLAWRAALGQRADGSLVYVGAPYLSAEGLADVLVGAGVKRAMVLDMNDYWTAGFYFRHKKDGQPLCRYLDPAIQGPSDRFLHPYKRDSFQFLARDGSGA